ncbi:hypothetical protein HDV63DRAFT_253980 [Trichoderma sp. SZMC 28014]
MEMQRSDALFRGQRAGCVSPIIAVMITWTLAVNAAANPRSPPCHLRHKRRPHQQPTQPPLTAAPPPPITVTAEEIEGRSSRRCTISATAFSPVDFCAAAEAASSWTTDDGTNSGSGDCPELIATQRPSAIELAQLRQGGNSCDRLRNPRPQENRGAPTAATREAFGLSMDRRP